MTLTFPNPSRSFDEARNAVRFTGYDGMLQVPFFVEADALTKIGADLQSSGALETKYLSAFDALRNSIYDVARKVVTRLSAEHSDRRPVQRGHHRGIALRLRWRFVAAFRILIIAFDRHCSFRPPCLLLGIIEMPALPR